jgi:hypothetical protein
MVLRREKVASLLLKYGISHGTQARIARELGVARSTITADVQSLTDSHACCPTCGSFVERSKIGDDGDDDGLDLG